MKRNIIVMMSICLMCTTIMTNYRYKDKMVRNVFIATDDISAINELRKNYTDYNFID